MLEFAGVLSGVDPSAITTYQITADPRNIQGNAVLVPSLGGDNMQAILAVFRGEAMLGEAPVQVIEPGADTTDLPTTTRPPASEPGIDPDTTVVPAPDTTLPNVQAEENQFGIVPDKNISC
jgi:hypothetical protein